MLRRRTGGGPVPPGGGLEGRFGRRPKRLGGRTAVAPATAHWYPRRAPAGRAYPPAWGQTRPRARGRFPRQPRLLRAGSPRLRRSVGGRWQRDPPRVRPDALASPMAGASGPPAGAGRERRTAVVGATVVRLPSSRRAAGSGPLRPAAEAASAGRAPLSIPRRVGFSFARRGPVAPALPWRQRFGADPRTGRATNAPPSQRRSSGPAVRRLGAASASGRSGIGRARPLADPAKGGLFFCSAGASSAGASLAPALWGGPSPGRASNAPPSQRRRSGPAWRRARGPLLAGRPKRQEMRRAPSPMLGRAAFLPSVGIVLPPLPWFPWVWGGPGAGSRYHCSAVAAAEVRSREAAGSGAASASGRSGERGRTTVAPATAAVRLCSWPGLPFHCAGIMAVRAMGRTRGRVTLPLRRRRRDGGPAFVKRVCGATKMRVAPRVAQPAECPPQDPKTLP